MVKQYTHISHYMTQKNHGRKTPYSLKLVNYHKRLSPSKLIKSQQIDHNMIYAKTQYANYAQESIFIFYDTTSEKMTP